MVTILYQTAWPLLFGATIALAIVLACIRYAIGTARQAQAQSAECLRQAELRAQQDCKQLALEARENILRERTQMLEEIEAKRKQFHQWQLRLEQQQLQQQHQLDDLLRREQLLEKNQLHLSQLQEQYEKRHAKLDQLMQQQQELLQQITGMDPCQAKQLLLDRLDQELRDELGERVLKFETRLKQECEQRAVRLLATAIQRYAAGHTAETTCAVVLLPNDEMKGRVIGRDGRNIRAFEMATGVDVIVDDTPAVVMVSAFDPIRREAGKLAMQRLVADGRIHPTRIEEVVAEVRDELEQHIQQLGRQAAEEVGIFDLHERLQTTLGRLKFRTSYSQNVYHHSLEVAYLAGMMAEEMGLDGTLARRCGLLHDIGKALDHEVEGGHPQVGADLARRCGENEIVLHAIANHHEEIRLDYPYTVLVTTADTISASRPGARRETLEKYIRRLEELEAVACEFPGVEAAYAVQAGREIRVIADANRTTDKSAACTCRDIARAIRQRLTFPGEIKVTVVRETRTVEFAR